MTNIIETRVQDHYITCPFCEQSIVPRVLVRIDEVRVRYTGTTGLKKNFSASTSTSIVKVEYRHECTGGGDE